MDFFLDRISIFHLDFNCGHKNNGKMHDHMIFDCRLSAPSAGASVPSRTMFGSLEISIPLVSHSTQERFQFHWSYIPLGNFFNTTQIFISINRLRNCMSANERPRVPLQFECGYTNSLVVIAVPVLVFPGPRRFYLLVGVRVSAERRPTNLPDLR